MSPRRGLRRRLLSCELVGTRNVQRRHSRCGYRGYCGSRDCNQQYLCVHFPQFRGRTRMASGEEPCSYCTGGVVKLRYVCTTFIARISLFEESVKACVTEVSWELDMCFENSKKERPGSTRHPCTS